MARSKNDRAFLLVLFLLAIVKNIKTSNKKERTVDDEIINECIYDPFHYCIIRK